MRTARAKGCGDARVMVRHVLRNALIPILTNVVVAIPFLFTGSLLLESFFGIPGLGSLTVEAIQGNDFATLRTMVYLGALLFILAQILTDVSYALADPRVRLELGGRRCTRLSNVIVARPDRGGGVACRALRGDNASGARAPRSSGAGGRSRSSVVAVYCPSRCSTRSPGSAGRARSTR